MNLKTFPLLAAAALLMAACAQMHDMSKMGDKDGEVPMADINTVGAIDLHNTVCPVSNDKVEDSKFIAVYDGKIYHFCCSDCPVDFKKDPEKYAKLVADDPAKYGVKAGN